MTSQPEALRLADALDSLTVVSMSFGVMDQAAAELRRLFQENEETQVANRRLHETLEATIDVNEQLRRWRDRLQELNEELLFREKRWSDLADIEVARCDKLQAINAQLVEALEYAREGLEEYEAALHGESYNSPQINAAIDAARKDI